MGILLVWYLGVGLLNRQTRDEMVIDLILNFMIAQMMLVFCDAPMPWGGGLSFHEIFSAEATWAASTLDMAVVNDVMQHVKDMWANMEQPSGLAILDYLTYFDFTLFLSVVWLFCSGITMIAHVALGFGALAGPLFIPFFIWPSMNWLFWGWVRFMITYALYIFSSSAIVYLYANCMKYFFTNIVNGVYTLGPLAALVMPFAVLQLIFVICFWQCHSWARDIATGSASMGSSVSGAVQAASVALLT
jgi:type IV secretory pathway VirB6-like protein